MSTLGEVGSRDMSLSLKCACKPQARCDPGSIVVHKKAQRNDKRN